MNTVEQIIIKGVRAKGSLKLTESSRRLLRMSCGKTVFKSKPVAMMDEYSLEFQEVGMHLTKEHADQSIMLEISERHEFGSLKQYELELHGSLPTSSIKPFKGDCIEVDLCDIHDQKVGIAVLVVDLFQKHRGFSEKINNETAPEKQRRSPSPTADNFIRHILTQNLLSNKLMTINWVILHNSFQDGQIQGMECFLMVRYGKLRNYTRPIKKFKEQIQWNDYLEFLIDSNLRYEFFLMYVSDTKDVVCRAKGQIKYIVFDKTIQSHSVPLSDRQNQPYGTLQIKFAEILANDTKGSAKPDKKIKQVQDKITLAIDEYNKSTFDGKYQGHILSPNLRYEQLKQLEQEQRQRPLNPEEMLIREENRRFVEFLQKELIKFDRQMEKQQKNKKKVHFLPLIPSPINGAMSTRNSHRTDEVHHSSVVALPKI